MATGKISVNSTTFDVVWLALSPLSLQQETGGRKQDCSKGSESSGLGVSDGSAYKQYL